MEEFQEMLFSEGYDSTKAVVRNWALLVSLSRVEQYRAECEFFQKKYGTSIEELNFRPHDEKNHENFEIEDDMADWQFSSEAVK